MMLRTWNIFCTFARKKIDRMRLPVNILTPKVLLHVPRIITDRAIVTYLLALITCNIIYVQYVLPWYWWFFGIVEVTGFFYFLNYLTRKRVALSIEIFTKRLFWTALAIRVAYVLFSYFFYWEMTDVPFEIGTADSRIYHQWAESMANMMRSNNFDLSFVIEQSYGRAVPFSDSGYPTYLAFVYLLSGNSIILVRLLKAVWSAWTVVLIYKLAQRNFGEATARIAGIMCLLMPNLIYYCGLHLKETEMVFLAVLFAERADYILRSRQFTIGSLLILLLIGTILFTFRTVLAAVLFLSLFAALLMSSQRIVSWGKRVLLLFVAALFVGVVLFTNTSVGQDVLQTWETGGTEQQANMEWRSQRKGAGYAQRFAKYAGASIFAPLIFTIPFPTMTDTPEHEGQKMIHGGNFVKNITSFFTIFALIMLLLHKGWRRHVLPICILCGYLVVLVFSNFAQSERFHLPTVPFAMMFAAYGISYMNSHPKYRSLFTIWCVLMFVAAIAWNWFKLAGRGLI